MMHGDGEGINGFVRDFQQLVAEAVSAGVDRMQADTQALRYELLSQSNEIKQDIAVLRESNVDVVRLLTHDNAVYKTGSHVYPSCNGSFLSRDVLEVPLPEDAGHSHSPSHGQQCSSVITQSRPVRPVPNGLLDKPNPKSNTKRSQQLKKGTVQNMQPARTSNTSNRSTSARGTGGVSGLLKPAPRGRNWIWVGGLMHETTSDNVVDHIKSHFPNNDLLVFDLKSKSKKKSFKVGSADVSLQDLLDSKLWPDGVFVKPFRPMPRK